MSGIVRVGGGGYRLGRWKFSNYASVAALPASGEAREIALISSTAIGRVMMRPTSTTTRPDGTAVQAGDVWIQTNDIAPLWYYVMLTKGGSTDGVVVHPQAAYQWSGSAWVERTAYNYSGGSWVLLQPPIIWWYNAGTDVVPMTTYTSEAATATKNAAYITLATYSANSSGLAGVRTGLINLTNLSTVTATYNRVDDTGSFYAYLYVNPAVLWTGRPPAASAVVALPARSSYGSVSLNVASLTGSYYVHVNYQTTSIYQTGALNLSQLYGKP